MQELYSKQVMDHFFNPRNYGEMKNPDGEATVGNPVCGDVMKMMIKVRDQRGIKVITDAKFQTLGCGAAIATSSIATEMIKGQPLDQALTLTNRAIAEALGGLPQAKMHCSVLAEEAVQKAIDNYTAKSKTPGQTNAKK